MGNQSAECGKWEILTANRPAQADFRVVAASRNPGVLTNAPAPPSAAARTVGIENAPPTQHAANTPTVANNVLLTR